MKNIFKHGITSNVLKTIAVIAMVLDHVAFYFVDIVPISVYQMLRNIGRIAMPIFVYLLVQGFFYTKNFKKYILRIGILAVITQICITALMIVNTNFVVNYVAAKQVYMNGNILFSFVILLGILKIIHEQIIIKKWDYNKNVTSKVIIIALIFIFSIFIPLDYGEEVLILGMLMYFIERLKIQVFMTRQNTNISLKTISLNILSEEKLKLLYMGLLTFSLVLYVIYFNKNLFTILAIFPIFLYSGQKGKSNNIIKYGYYVLFPLHHVLLYSLAMIVALT